MGSMLARDLRDSLQKAKGVGLVEERFTIDDCEVVVRSLRPDEYEAILADCKPLDDVEYLNAFQMAHVARAIVELNGQDLRDVLFIEDEEPDPKKSGQMRPVKRERYRWLQDNVLGSWGKEAIYVAYRKVSDAVERAEKKSQEGIRFIIPDETPEEKFRRIVGEMVEAQTDVPGPIIEKVFDDCGLMLKTTADEAKRVMEAATMLAREEIERDKAQAVPEPEPIQEPLVQAGPSPQDLMRARQPLNTTAVQVVKEPSRQAPNVVPATRNPAPTPPQGAQQSHQLQGPPVLGSRSAQMAALEAEADEVGALTDGPPAGFDPRMSPQEVPVLEHRQAQADPKAVEAIVDQPPRVGLNPMYRPARKA